MNGSSVFNFLIATANAAGANAVGPEAASSWVSILFSGGIFGVAIILLLVTLSMTTVYLAFDQIMSLRRNEVIPPTLTESVRQSLAAGNVAEADAACRQQPSVMGVVLLCGLAEVELGYIAVQRAMEDALAQQSARLMRRIDYLAVIGNIAPMIGLLGTVIGMIAAFRTVAETRGAAGAGDLAEGIYQALVTTVGGLLVAIPALGIHAVCRNRVESLIAETAYQCEQALAPVKRRIVGRTPR